jgi:hypothetical protein
MAVSDLVRNQVAGRRLAPDRASDFTLVLDSNMGMPEMQLLLRQLKLNYNVKGFSTFLLLAEF